MTGQQHEWTYFRAGSVVQVELKTGADLLQLSQLDQKLWMALAMPTRGLNCDHRTLDLLDSDKDGRIRPPELVAAIEWLAKTLVDPGIILSEGQSLELSQIKDSLIHAGAERALHQLNKSGTMALEAEDLDLAVQKFSAEVLNGDGVIIPGEGQDPTIKGLLEHIVQYYDSVSDRSGKAGVDAAILQRFFADLDARAQWFMELEREPELVPFGLEMTALAFQASEAVSKKIEDYFTRCHWIAFDARAADIANRPDSELLAATAQLLNPHSKELADLPLAQAQADAVLSLESGLNPAWQKPMQYFIETALQAMFGQQLRTLTEDQWRQLQKRLQPYSAWRGREPQSKVAHLDRQKIAEWRQPQLRENLQQLIQADLALAPEFSSLSDVQRLLLYRRDLGRILRNFVNFSDFYRHRDGVFQAGTLFIDGRAAELCIEVSNAVRHTAMAGLSGAYLAYCDINRVDQPARSVVALLTDGDSDNISVGRNGVFYDRSGRDWDATVTRIVANPISLREAFWLPYKKLARFIEEQVAKRATAAESTQTADLSSTAQAMANIDKTKAPDLFAGKKVDVGTVAALGVALGSISTFLGLLFSRFLDLGILMPFGVVALVLLISGPAMVLAWLKLKNRNLGPILDANGWAINTVARINVPFASSMTSLREVPLLHSGMLLPDPYAERRRPWRVYGTAIMIGLLILAWALGRWDRYLPDGLQSKNLQESFKKF